MIRACLVVTGALLMCLLAWMVVVEVGESAHATPSGTTTTTTADAVETQHTKTASLAQVEALVAASVRVENLNEHMYHEMARVDLDRADLVEGIPIKCMSASSGCVFGDLRSGVDVVLFGDSHVRMWLPAIIPTADADHLRLVIVGEDGCPVVSPSVPGHFGACGAVVAKAISVINALRPAAVIISDRTSYTGVTPAEWQRGMTTTMTDLRSSGAKIAIVGDIQPLNAGTVSYVLPCLINHAHAVQACAVPNPNRAATNHISSEEKAAQRAHDTYINPTPWLCTRSSCSPIIGGNLVYWDSFHITTYYAVYLSGVMGNALRPFLTAALHTQRT